MFYKVQISTNYSKQNIMLKLIVLQIAVARLDTIRELTRIERVCKRVILESNQECARGLFKIVVCPFVLFPLAIVLSVLRYTDSD
jgi:hypothetical protein